MATIDTPADRERRTRMVLQDLADCVDERVREAMAATPRHCFVAPEARDRAYADSALAIAAGQTISQPRVVARMLELLALRPGQQVLDVGAGSGYVSALLARLVHPGGRVDAVERQEELVTTAREVLAERASITGDAAAPIEIHLAGDRLGWPERAPFDRIHVACAAPELPPALVAQLAPGGRLVAPIGPQGGQRLTVVVKDADGAITVSEDWAVVFVPLIEGGG